MQCEEISNKEVDAWCAEEIGRCVKAAKVLGMSKHAFFRRRKGYVKWSDSELKMLEAMIVERKPPKLVVNRIVKVDWPVCKTVMDKLPRRKVSGTRY